MLNLYRRNQNGLMVGGAYFSYFESAQMAFEANNHQFAFECFNAAMNSPLESQRNRAIATRLIGQYHHYGYGVIPRDRNIAVQYYQQAVIMGDQMSQMVLNSINTPANNISVRYYP